MNHERHNLLAIGAFASATRFSLKALRLYDQLGLLRPRYVDPDSSYRYYHADQLRDARLIRMMRQMDMPLATIRQVLAASPADAELLVRLYWRALEARIEQGRRTVQNLILALHMEDDMALEVQVQTVESQPIVSVTKRIKVDQLDAIIRDSLATLEELIQREIATATGAPFGIYHGPINNDDDGPIEICVPTDRTLNGSGDVQGRILEGGKVASVVLHSEECEFPAILQGYDTTHDWIQRNGYQTVGSPREIWHSPPGADARMEIAWLFKEA